MKKKAHARGGRCFRLVGSQGEISVVEELLTAEGYRFEPEPFYAAARRLTSEPKPLGSSLAAAFGRIYIQDKSSMLPPLLISPQQGQTTLDMCASPGGKTSLLAALAGPESFTAGNEPNPARLETMRRNMSAMDVLTVATCCKPGENLPMQSGSVPNILLDPPCSGWGTADKHPKVKKLWSGDKVAPLVELQKKLLDKACDMLSPGGRLMYSTCTTNVEENEAQVRRILELRSDMQLRKLSAPQGFNSEPPLLPAAEGSLRIAGGDEQSEGQGFFLALLEKSKTDRPIEFETETGGELPGRPLSDMEIDSAAWACFEKLPPGELMAFNDAVHFLPQAATSFFPAGLRWKGHPLGKVKGGVFRARAGARCLLPEEPGQGDVSLESAEDLTGLIEGRGIAHSAKKGGAGLYFRGLPLGRLLIKGGRALWSP